MARKRAQANPIQPPESVQPSAASDTPAAPQPTPEGRSGPSGLKVALFVWGIPIALLAVALIKRALD